MGCAGCSIKTADGSPVGCRNNGNCSTGGCNRLNTFDWLAAMEIEDVEPFNVVEVSFKNGARKAFYFNQPFVRATTGDQVVVETQAGSDIGRVSLTGELVRLQMRKKKVKENSYFPKIIRVANERDLEKLDEIRSTEKTMMVRARAIARTLDLNMKIGDVDVQADGRKATFFYTAEGRVDFRELIRHFAKEFKIKIEMRQIGARQESARIGGIGPCGRELCCSTWLTSYKSVSTAAARYQNLAINQAKLSGQCGRLKCCLNYELDTYMEALSNFPADAEKLQTEEGRAMLLKTDIFKGIMYYGYEKEGGHGRFYPLDLNQVRKIREMNLKGKKPVSLEEVMMKPEIEEPPVGFSDDVTGFIELPTEERNRKKKNKKDNNRRKDKSNQPKQRDSSTEANENQPARPNDPNQEKDRRDNRDRKDKKDRRDKKDRKSDRPNSGANLPQAKAPAAPPDGAASGPIDLRPVENKGQRPPKGKRGGRNKFRGKGNKGNDKAPPAS